MTGGEADCRGCSRGGSGFTCGGLARFFSTTTGELAGLRFTRRITTCADSLGGGPFRGGMSSLLSTSIPSVKTTPLSFSKVFHEIQRSKGGMAERRYLLSAWAWARFVSENVKKQMVGEFGPVDHLQESGHDPCPIARIVYRLFHAQESVLWEIWWG